MGSTFIERSGFGKTASEVFKRMYDNDQGNAMANEGYSGSIGSARHGFKMVPLDQKKFTDAALKRWEDKAVDDHGKYDPMCCLEYPQSYAKGKGRGIRLFVFMGWVPE